MVTRRNILSNAADDCMKELYSFAKPSIEWNKFIEENKIYSNKYKAWERFIHLYNKKKEKTLTESELKEYSTFPIKNWEGKNKYECIGPAPYEFYYLPKEIMKDICDSYIYAYRIDHQQELLNTIEILKEYCRKPIVDKYIDDWTDETGFHHSGYRSYDNPDNLEKEIYKYLDSNFTGVEFINAEILQDKFFEFLDMAGNFYNWNSELNSFNTTIYLGCSPNSNKEAVIENWKKYRNQDIEINEEQIKKEYYGEEDFDE